ncbi:MAG: flagellar hook-associated protein FlgK [Paracoccaceae bacterium]|nr:flagellar hook-associated protein FlgK [Paracoccaceae bacterium]
MGISAAMANAASGLAANGLATEVISANIANAQTAGYGVRELLLVPNPTGGVAVDGVSRLQDLSLLNDQRSASAALAGSGVNADFYKSIETAIGVPTDSGSLGASLTALDSALIGAAAQPDSDAALSAVLSSAKTVAAKINTISGQIQSARGSADQAIARDVNRLNTTLQQVAGLNAQIQKATLAQRDASSLMDKRQSVIDSVADIVPINQVSRQNGTVALFTTGGAGLLDGTKPASLGFTPAAGMTADQTLAGGGLSGLTLNGSAIRTDSALVAGGSLAANFELRDTTGPLAQAGIDALARDLSSRFQTADSTLSATAAGLFTDAGAQVSAANEVGLAGRLTINAAVDPARGGSLAKLRDGLGSSGPGPVGNGAILAAMDRAMTALSVPASGDVTATAVDSPGLAAALLGKISTARLAAEGASSYASAQSSALTAEALKNGVSTDQQLQQLLLVERSYSANARVMQTADTMLQALMNV